MNFKTILFIAAITISTSASAQNLTLAKAFFKKAQQEYSKKNYTQVFTLLDKAKEQLGGDTNAQIIYLEAKAHYNSDINVNKAKKLLNQFLEEAEPNDSRIDEISSIIVDIEVSDKIDKYGNFKDITGRSGVKTSYYDSGEKEWVQEYKNGKKEGFIKRYNKKGVLIQSGTQKNGYVNGFYEWFDAKGKLHQTNYYDQYGKKTKEQKHYNTTTGELYMIYIYVNGKKNGHYKYFFRGILSTEGNFENDKKKGKWINYYTNGKVSSTYTYNNTPSYDTKIASYLEGVKTSYYENGTKLSEENYVKGKKQGPQKYYYENGNLNHWEYLNADGKLNGERAYYFKSNGKRHINITYENGKAMELLEQVDINGNKIKISKLKKGNGYIKRANAAGVIIYEANIVDGYEEGIVKSFYDSGKLHRIEHYKAGKPIGINKTYFEDGSIKSTWDNDKKRGKFNYVTHQTDALFKLIKDNKTIDDIIAYCKSKNPIGKDFYLSEDAINRLGYYYLTDKKNTEDALKIFKLNIEFHPNAWNTYDSYGECLAKANRIDEATQAFKKSLELNPKNENAIKFLKNPKTFFSKIKSNTNKINGENFLKENKTKKGVQTTVSGLQYIILKQGEGKKPESADVRVKVHYHGTTISGDIIDSSIKSGKPTELNIKDLIKGWTEGIQLMNVGSKYKFFIPHQLAYGNSKMGIVEPFSVLIYEIELLEISEN
ncbi:FKBP-type peptidyl-prolyl cis-trans isomerase [Snuella sedimenti]|uniref:peptidylprolyl isomerase n=1 Tax=Snuella sedimenti TaxID=2798802 RepID=A0A8J7ITV4_9FLAO|nr:FKBP-type peptidyl-prolyl cis-trans isomerase [Snuella sedimenti]MBJ6366475.1 FKBP-type peptidyl-prolyl cis-trans isomerase [Snuella sedimenti]